MPFDAAWTRIIGSVLAITGLVVLLLGMISLGRSISIGLSREETELKTRGIYTVTRNPLYVGGFLVCIGSCFYSVHPLNLLLCALAGVIHHRIVLKEEQFLRERFGTRWEEYAGKVPRYIGWPNTHPKLLKADRERNERSERELG